MTTSAERQAARRARLTKAAQIAGYETIDQLARAILKRDAMVIPTILAWYKSIELDEFVIPDKYTPDELDSGRCDFCHMPLAKCIC